MFAHPVGKGFLWGEVYISIQIWWTSQSYRKLVREVPESMLGRSDGKTYHFDDHKDYLYQVSPQVPSLVRKCFCVNKKS